MKISHFSEWSCIQALLLSTILFNLNLCTFGQRNLSFHYFLYSQKYSGFTLPSPTHYQGYLKISSLILWHWEPNYTSSKEVSQRRDVNITYLLVNAICIRHARSLIESLFDCKQCEIRIFWEKRYQNNDKSKFYDSSWS